MGPCTTSIETRLKLWNSISKSKCNLNPFIKNKWNEDAPLLSTYILSLDNEISKKKKKEMGNIKHVCKQQLLAFY